MIYLEQVKSGKFITGPILYANKKNMTKGTIVMNFSENMDSNLNTFKSIKNKLGNVVIPALRGYYIPATMFIKLGDKKARLRLLELLNTIRKTRGEYKIQSIFAEYDQYKDTNTFYDFSPYLSKVKNLLSGRRPTRAMNIDALNFIRGTIENFKNHQNKVILFDAPLLSKLGIKGEVIQDSLQYKQFSPALLLLLWAQNSPDDFRGWMKDNGITLAFKNDRQTVLFKHTDIQTTGGESAHFNYNFRDELIVQKYTVEMDDEVFEESYFRISDASLYLEEEEVDFSDIDYETIYTGGEAGYSDGIDSHMMLRRIRRLDTATETDELIHEDDYTEIDDINEVPNEIDSDEALIAVITGSEPEPDEEVEEVEEEASVAIIDAVEDTDKAKLEDIIDIMNDTEKSEAAKSTEIIEKVSYQEAMKDLETPEIKAYRKKMNKKFGPQSLEEAAIIAAQNVCLINLKKNQKN